MNIKIKLDHPDAIAPSYATDGAAGMDLYSIESITIPSKWTHLANTGVSIEIPQGYEGQIRPRSGLAAKMGLTVLNSPGTIDSDYRGEIRVLLINHGLSSAYISKGDRIAQIVFAKHERVNLIQADVLDETTRNTGGFGSTGK